MVGRIPIHMVHACPTWLYELPVLTNFGNIVDTAVVTHSTSGGYPNMPNHDLDHYGSMATLGVPPHCGPYMATIVIGDLSTSLRSSLAAAAAAGASANPGPYGYQQQPTALAEWTLMWFGVQFTLRYFSVIDWIADAPVARTAAYWQVFDYTSADPYRVVYFNGVIIDRNAGGINGGYINRYTDSQDIYAPGDPSHDPNGYSNGLTGTWVIRRPTAPAFPSASWFWPVNGGFASYESTSGLGDISDVIVSTAYEPDTGPPPPPPPPPPPAGWVDISVPGQFNTILDITYVGGTTWVLVRSSSIERSTDNGLTWTEVVSASAVGYYRCVASGGGHVIVGMNNNLYLDSTDSGATWTAEQTGPFTVGAIGGLGRVDAITFATGVFMAVAQGWTSRTSNASTWTTPVPSLGASQSIDYAAGQWIVIPFVGYTQYARSYDGGDTWAALSYPSPVLDMDVARYSASHDRWIGRGRQVGGAPASTNNVFVSTDNTATGWVGVTVNSTGGPVEAVGFLGDLVVIGRVHPSGGAGTQRMVVSTDLVTWTDETSPFDAFDNVVYAFDSGAGRIIAVGNGGVIAYRTA